MYELHCQMLAPVSIQEAFAVFENPANLARITPPWLNFQITSKDPVEMRRGAEIEYRIRWLNVPVKWKTVITQYDPPFSFVDEQARGPYTLWRHRHAFREVDGGTLVNDVVRYQLPMGPLGSLAHRLLVARQLKEIFEFRQQALRKIWGGGPL